MASFGFAPIPREAFGPREPWEEAMDRVPGTWIHSMRSGNGGTALAGDVVLFDCRMKTPAGKILVDTYRTGVPLRARLGTKGLWDVVLFGVSRNESRFSIIPSSTVPQLKSEAHVWIEVLQVVRASSIRKLLGHR